MSAESANLLLALESHGAVPDQLVDLTAERPRTLRYRDLVRASARPVVALESQGQPRAYVFDARGTEEIDLGYWIRRIAFRGDADFVGVLRPGRLDVHAIMLGKDARLGAPIPLPQGRFRIPALLHTPPPGEARGVHAALRDLLRGSIAKAVQIGKGAGVDAHDAISLVGRALFWRFLIDRDLLSGLDPAALCGDDHVGSFAECLVTRARAVRTFEWLDRTFNGGLLMFRTPRRANAIPEGVYKDVVGNVAHAATAYGQLQLDLPRDWRDVNFAHVPVGLLSEVYEAFVHDEDAERAEQESVYYTPRHIAELMVAEALNSVVGDRLPRVLDPAAGAGVFLVAVFRALVVREWERTGLPPSRPTVRRILHKNLTGFDINDSALRLAELALYLTAIELDPEPTPKPLSLLRFAKPLRDTALHLLRPHDVTRGSLEPVAEAFRQKFDLVIGNPPWTGKKARAADKNRWAADTRALVETRLGSERARVFTFPDTYPDTPFIYRSMEWAKPSGQIALVTHARWLFPGKTRDQGRRDLLESVRVTGILNGASLRRPSVWPSIEAPFCVLFAVNTAPEPESAFQFVTPRFVPDASSLANRIRIDWTDAQVVQVARAVSVPWLLKARFRGTTFDEPIVERLVADFPTVATYLLDLGCRLRNGYILPRPEQARRHNLRGLPNLTSDAERQGSGDEGPPQGFRIRTQLLRPLEIPRLHTPLKREDCAAPLLLIKKSPPEDPALPRVAISERDLAFSQSWHGASFAGVDNGAARARWLQLLLQSNVFLHFALLTDGWFGVERDHYSLETLKAFPIVPFERLTAGQDRIARKLSDELWGDGWSKGLEGRIDDLAFDAYGLDDVERACVQDTLATSLPYARTRHRALAHASSKDTSQFVDILEKELTHVLEASDRRTHVRLRSDVTEGPWSVLQVDRFATQEGQSSTPPIPWKSIFEEAESAGATLITVRIDTITTLVAILRNYRYWTPTRARILALTLLSGEDP